MTAPLSEEERRAVAALKRLAKRWPSSLWLFSGNGELHVMRTNAAGERVYASGGGVDSAYSVATIDIANDGGDW